MYNIRVQVQYCRFTQISTIYEYKYILPKICFVLVAAGGHNGLELSTVEAGFFYYQSHIFFIMQGKVCLPKSHIFPQRKVNLPYLYDFPHGMDFPTKSHVFLSRCFFIIKVICISSGKGFYL